MPASDSKLHVFFSYAREDYETVSEVYNRLKVEEWIESWLDDYQILAGEPWEIKINEAINDSDVVIIFLSKDSINNKGFFHKEMHVALDRSYENPQGVIYRIPIRLDDIEIPGSLYKLNDYQWVDYFGTKKEEAYERLRKSLHRCFEQKIGLESQHGHKNISEIQNNFGAINVANPPGKKDIFTSNIFIYTLNVISIVMIVFGISYYSDYLKSGDTAPNFKLLFGATLCLSAPLFGILGVLIGIIKYLAQRSINRLAVLLLSTLIVLLIIIAPLVVIVNGVN